MGLSDNLDAVRRGNSTTQNILTNLARNAETMSIMSQASTIVDKNERDPEKDMLQGMANLDVGNLKVVDDGRKIIVGVDFGTTFSGLAWAETRRVSRINHRYVCDSYVDISNAISLITRLL